MNIKTKILITNGVMLISAVLIILLSILFIIDRGIEKQTETLLKDLSLQSRQRINSTNKVLQRLVMEPIRHVQQETTDFCHYETVMHGTHKGQWKAVFAHAESVCQNANLDFLVVFDNDGKVQVSWPSLIDTRYPEKHFKELPFFKNFGKYIDEEDLVNTPVFSSIEKWNKQVLNGYYTATDNDSNIVFIAAGIIPNDYFDEPLGYVLTGITANRLQKTLDEFHDMTNSIAILADGEIPLVWAGLHGEKKDVKKILQAYLHKKDQKSLEKDAVLVSSQASHEYHIHGSTLEVMSTPTLQVSDAAKSTQILSGESGNLIIESGDKIRQEGIKTSRTVLNTSLIVVFFILALAAVVVNFLGSKIAEPIKVAADISDKIASGDLEHILAESSSDETGRLSKSMNKMIETLKELRNRNERSLKELQDSKVRNEKILAAMQEGVMLVDANTKTIIDVNPAAERMIKEERNNIIGREYHEYIRSNEEQNPPEGLNNNISGYREGVVITRDRNRTPIVRANIPIMLDNQECLLETFTDITHIKDAQNERRRLEEQLQLAKKMEAIGLLAGGVAHDLNNVLSGIVSYPDLLLMQVPETSSLRKPIETIKQSGKKAAAIVQDLLTLARRGVANTEVLNLNDIITEYLNSPELDTLKSLHPQIDVKTDLKKGLLNIMGSPVHLSKTFMNLVSNAAEAMSDGGEILISTENRYLDRPVKVYADIIQGDYVVVSISDTGAGISSKDKERLFEPFYTKKVMDRSGTGLGLSVVWGTLKDHKGYIDIQTDEGEGTTFILYFPITIEELATKNTGISVDKYLGTGEYILVVDDVAEQRDIARTILIQLGYKVSTVSSGEKAVEFIRNQKVDLVVLDMIMDPGIDGLDTYKQIIEVNPEQKAIIASGFSETDRVKETQRLGVGQYIKKPYTIETIGIAVWNEIRK